MTVGWAPSLALAIRIFGAPSTTDWAVGAHAEVAGGSIPLAVDEAVSPAAEAFFELHTGVRLHDPTSTLILRYAPRLFGRLPGTEQLGRPLLLHTLSLAYVAQPAPRWTFGATGIGSIGEVAYSNVQGFFPAGTGPVGASSISLMMGDLATTAAFESSRRNTMRLTLRTGAQAPLPGDEAVLPRFVSAGVEVADDYRLNRRDTLTLTANSGYFRSSDFGAIVLSGGEGALVRRTGPLSHLRFQGGALAAQSSSGRGLQVIPTASAAYGTGWGERSQPWFTEIAGGTRGFFDPLNFDYRPVAFVNAEVSTIVHPSFRTGAHVSAFTSISSRPAELTPFETIGMLELPSSYRLSTQVELLFGGRASWFSPHLSAFSGGPQQGQFLVFVGVRHHDGTAPTRGSWLN